MIKVIIADDHTIFRQGLTALLRSVEEMDIAIAGEASDGREALGLIQDVKPDLAILDISMPSLSGLEITRQILKKGINTRVIMLTMHKDLALADKAIKFGAHGYILKDNAIEDLIYAIRTVMQGGKFISPSISGEILTIRHKDKDEKTTLTNREKEIISLIVSGLSNKEIAKRLFISIKTVETHRSRIMYKLDIHNTAELVRHAIENGLY